MSADPSGARGVRFSAEQLLHAAPQHVTDRVFWLRIAAGEMDRRSAKTALGRTFWYRKSRNPSINCGTRRRQLLRLRP
jgi:hypothetical protein